MNKVVYIAGLMISDDTARAMINYVRSKGTYSVYNG